MDLNDIIANINRAIADRPADWRVGQAAFNALARIEGGWASAINGTPADPFYRNERMPEFWDAVEILHQARVDGTLPE